MERVPQYNGVPADQRQCPVCGTAMKSMGFTHCEHLDVMPAKVVVVHRSAEALKCPLDGTIVSAPPPPRIVGKGVLGNRLIMEATADKFLEHQPIERQCLRFVRSGVDIAPRTLGRAVRAHLELLAPIARAIHERLGARACSQRMRLGSPCWIAIAQKGFARAQCGRGRTRCG